MKTINDINVFEPGDVINIECVQIDYAKKRAEIQKEAEEHHKSSIEKFGRDTGIAPAFFRSMEICDNKINYLKGTTKLLIIGTTINNSINIWYKCMSQWGLITRISAKDLRNAKFEKSIDELKTFLEEIKH